MKANRILRDYMYTWGIKHYQVAEELGVHEMTLCRWLRYELTDDKKEMILQAIERIKASKLSNLPVLTVDKK